MTEEQVRQIIREEIAIALCRDCAPNGEDYLRGELIKAFAAADEKRKG